jgi:hypothetical protein
MSYAARIAQLGETIMQRAEVGSDLSLLKCLPAEVFKKSGAPFGTPPVEALE